MLSMLSQQKLVSHSRDVVANDDVARIRLGKLLVRSGHGARRSKVIREKLFQAFHRAVAVFGNGRMIVDMSKQESLQAAILCRGFFAESRQPFRSTANVLGRGDM